MLNVSENGVASGSHFEAPRRSTVVRARSAVFILAAPPLTSGERTIERVNIAQSILQFDEVTIANLFPLPTVSVLDISSLGRSEDSWVAGREQMRFLLEPATDAVLAFGVSAPTGEAREHHRRQVEWLFTHLAQIDVKVWTVGGRTTHPSRWQRHTHNAFPELPFREALEESFQSGDSRRIRSRHEVVWFD